MVRRTVACGLFWAAWTCYASEPSRVCYRSVAEAAAQGEAGLAADGGFRLEALRWDPLMGRSWASVRSCAHPEQPAWTVAVAKALASAGMEKPSALPVELKTSAQTLAQLPLQIPAPMVLAGAAVRVIRLEANVRLEIAGVAQASGRLGERISVRLSGTGQQVLMGVVRSAGLLELEP